jgi:site-specific recombinase XerD
MGVSMNILELLPSYSEYLQFERGFAKSTLRAYLSDLRELSAICPGDAKEITVDDLRRYQRGLTMRGLVAATIERKIAAATTFWRWMRIEGHVSEVLTERLVKPRKRHTVARWLADDELRTLLETPVKRYVRLPGWINQRDSLAWGTMAHLGLRRSEVVALLAKDVIVADRVVIIRGIKNRRDRVMPLPTALLDHFQEAIGRAEDYIFPDLYGGQWLPQTLATAFRTHLRNCGLADRGITPHSLRHTFATRLIRAGVNPVDVQSLLGHVDIKSTMKYVHVGAEHLRAAIDGPLYVSPEAIQ